MWWARSRDDFHQPKEYNMKRFILTSVAAALAVVFSCSTSLEASPPRGASHGHVASHVHVAPGHAHVASYYHYHTIHGHSVRVYVGGYRDWAYRCWFPFYRTYGYYSGPDQVWYYWYAPFGEYLPITYMSIYPPTPATAPVGVVPSAPSAPVALPSGATYIPGPISAP
jgi:hypothetical protein